MKKNSFVRFAGIAAVLVYITTVAVGGFLYPHYSHLSQAISELVGSYAPTRQLLNPFFLVYNLLLGLFAYELYQKCDNKFTKAASIFLLITAVASILMWWFPMDSRGYPATVKGSVHIMLASIDSLSTILATLLFGIGIKKINSDLATVSFLLTVVIAVTGITAGIMTAQGSAYSGLFERITIGSFLLWVAVVNSI